MARAKIKTIEAIYEQGLLRPLEPLERRAGLVYLVTVLDMAAIEKPKTKQNSWRGKYRGHLSLSDNFAKQKESEKSLEQ